MKESIFNKNLGIKKPNPIRLQINLLDLEKYNIKKYFFKNGKFFQN